MKKLTFLALLIPCLAIAQTDGNYILTIDGKPHNISLDKQTTLTTGSGQKIEVKLSQKPILTYDDGVVRFQYPKAFQPAGTDLGEGIEQVALISNLGSGFLVQEYSTMNPTMLNEMMLTEITKESVEYGYTMEREDYEYTTKTGQKMKGVKATLRYKDDVQHFTVMSYGKKDFGVLVVTMLNDEFRDKDEGIINTFMDSFQILE